MAPSSPGLGERGAGRRDHGESATAGHAFVQVVDDGEHRLPAHEDRIGVRRDRFLLLFTRVHEVAVLADDVTELEGIWLDPPALVGGVEEQVEADPSGFLDLGVSSHDDVMK